MNDVSKNPPSIRELREEAAQQPDSAEAQWRLGTALLRVGFLSQGEQALEKAVELNPDMVRAWVNLGGARLSRWDFQGCIDANSRALKCNPKLVRAQFNLGLGYLYLGKVAETVRSFQRVIELDPEFADGYYHLAVGLHAAGRTEEAREALGEAMIRGYSPEPDFVRELEKHDGASSPPLVVELEGARNDDEGVKAESNKG